MTTKKTILAFDTATNACTVALQHGEKIFLRHIIAPREQASLLLPQIQALLDDAALDLSDIAAIAFGYGPGSFMGVRLATAMAQGLAFGLKIPLIPVSSLQILAQTAHEKTGAKNILAGWDARMHEVYWGFYEVNTDGIAREIICDQLSAPAAMDSRSFPEIGFTMAGNAWEVYKDQLPKALLEQPMLVDIYPEASAMLTIANSKYLANEVISADNAHPHYIRHQVVHRKI